MWRGTAGRQAAWGRTDTRAQDVFSPAQSRRRQTADSCASMSAAADVCSVATSEFFFFFLPFPVSPQYGPVPNRAKWHTTSRGVCCERAPHTKAPGQTKAAAGRGALEHSRGITAPACTGPLEPQKLCQSGLGTCSPPLYVRIVSLPRTKPAAIRSRRQRPNDGRVVATLRYRGTCRGPSPLVASASRQAPRRWQRAFGSHHDQPLSSHNVAHRIIPSRSGSLSRQAFIATAHL